MRRPATPTRRRLLGTLAALGATGLAGCDALSGGDAPVGDGGSDRGTDARGTDGADGTDGAGEAGSARGATADSPTAEATPDPELEQTVTVGNPNATAAYVTVAAESAAGGTAFAESVELTPGERRHVAVELPAPGTYRVVAESAAGARETFEWTADERLGGLSVTLLPDGFDVWRAATCRGDCALGRSDAETEIPLVGDGSGRWYAPASVVLENPGPETRRARVAVETDGEAVLTATYDVPNRTRVELPVTYRSGEYRVRVETAAGSVTETWSVPDRPSLVVGLGDRTTGCGPANSELSVINYDDVEHAVAVRIKSAAGETAFADRWTLAPRARTSVVPVSSSGRYGVRVRVDDRDSFDSVWWSCPPRGPAAVVVDAAGNGSLRRTAVPRP